MLTATLATWFILATASASAEPVRAAYPSANVQFLPAFVALAKGFYKRESLDAELISVRSAVTAVQALLGNQIHFIFSVGPQMPSILEGSDIMWQAVALNVKPKRPARDCMDLRFVNEVLAELGQK